MLYYIEIPYVLSLYFWDLDLTSLAVSLLMTVDSLITAHSQGTSAFWTYVLSPKHSTDSKGPRILPRKKLLRWQHGKESELNLLKPPARSFCGLCSPRKALTWAVRSWLVFEYCQRTFYGQWGWNSLVSCQCETAVDGNCANFSCITK